ncbi:MBL fold metallo-hydrolase [Paenibacillus humicus]|uniref:MBL fold metallo-hydrolase n=1 Tax=Paenibacillus humicus TaxID=412861 RepID=UPI000FDCCE57|nr:MBL fold metallo-hydrolase [Paenibacillus humicus]
MKLTDRISALVIPMREGQPESAIHPVLLQDEDGATLIDTGMMGQYDLLVRAIEAEGLSVSDVKRIIVTHQDIDHIGSLHNLQVCTPHLEVYAHADERPYIEGELPLIKLSRERLSKAMPPEQLEALLANPPRGHVNRLVVDGERLPLQGGIQIIHTPGHTPGHISLFMEKEGLLIAADALRVVNGELVGPSEPVTPDMPQALRSLLKLAELPVQRVLCYHGGLYEKEGISARIAEIAAEGLRD